MKTNKDPKRIRKELTDLAKQGDEQPIKDTLQDFLKEAITPEMPKQYGFTHKIKNGYEVWTYQLDDGTTYQWVEQENSEFKFDRKLNYLGKYEAD